MAELPCGTVTFLLTDIEGSTRLWQEHPSAMRSALMRHDSLAASVIAGHGGVLVRARGEGDSLFCVFSRATDALAAASALQRAFAAEAWPAEAPLRVRMALHTGEADLRDDGYYGTVVNRCARLRAVAYGRQVLLSQTVYDLVRDHLPAGVTLLDLGAHRRVICLGRSTSFSYCTQTCPPHSRPSDPWTFFPTTSPSRSPALWAESRRAPR